MLLVKASRTSLLFKENSTAAPFLCEAEELNRGLDSVVVDLDSAGCGETAVTGLHGEKFSTQLIDVHVVILARGRICI